MGYNTYYSIDFPNKDLYGEDLTVVASKHAVDDIEYALSDGSCPFKWYEHEEDLRECSKKLPGKLIRLKGWGEDVGDMWVKYFLDGKMQRIDLVFDPPFDPRQLK